MIRSVQRLWSRAPWRVALIGVCAIVVASCGGLRIIAIHDPLTAEEHLALGVAYERDGKRDRAESEYLAALRVEPDHVPALVNLGNLEAAAGDATAAESWYQRAVRIGGPPAASGANNLAWLYVKQGRRLASAEELARQAVQWDPRPEHVDTLVDILVRRGTPLEASAAIDEAAARTSDPQAVARLQKLLEDDVRQIATLSAEQARAHLDAGRVDDAGRYLREAIRRDGDRAPKYLEPLADAVRKSPTPEEMVRLIDDLHKTMGASPGSAAVFGTLARAAHDRSRRLVSEARFAIAEKLVRGALRWDSARAPYYLDTLAHVLIVQEKPYEAGKIIDEAEKLASESDRELRARLLERKAELFSSKGLAGEAKAAAEQAEAIRKATSP